MAVSSSEVRNYRYFFYSEQQIRKRNDIEAAIGKRFVPGTVYVDGKQEKYTEICKKNTSMYPDAKLVTEGYLEDMKYTRTTSVAKRK